MSRRRKARGALFSTALALSLVLLAPARAAAWGEEGHEVVAHLAQRMLTAKTDGVVKQLLLQGETVENVASWADTLRGSSKKPGPRPETSLWHFVDIPIGRDYVAAEDCMFLLNGPCVIDALYGVEVVLANPGKGYYRNSRYEALKYAIHLVGDMHQPLHCSDDDDSGGNFKDVTWKGGARISFHAVWDDAILQANIAAAKKDPKFHKTGDDATDYADYLFAKMTAAEKADAQPKFPQGAVVPKDELIAWAAESHALGQAAYKHLPTPKPDKSYDLSNGDYYEMHKADVEMQLRRGGVRLARLLNETLKK